MGEEPPIGLPSLLTGNRNDSSWPLRTWFFRKYHRVRFGTVRLLPVTPGFAGQIARYSLTGRVQVLLHDGRTIRNSLAICGYAADNLVAMAKKCHE